MHRSWRAPRRAARRRTCVLNAAPDASGTFARRLLRWYGKHGRHDLPWVGERDPYRVWLSEVMLQQTRVATTLPYFSRFLARFPDVRSLAQARAGEVMAAWAGLGYYARARNLHACARAVVQLHQGRYPNTAQALAQLPGIGQSTAAAIAAFCFDERAAVLDANARRVLARHWAIEGDVSRGPAHELLLQRARMELPAAREMARYTQAIMDLGATVCTKARPICDRCPVGSTCRAHRQGRTGELPAARPRGERPVRRVHVLLALAQHKVAVQRRPANGIWGGLLCLPQFESRGALLRRARSLGAILPSHTRLAPRQHALTHLTLALQPHVALVRADAGAAASDPQWRWVPLDRVGGAGLPAPHRELLRELREGLLADGPPRIPGSDRIVPDRAQGDAGKRRQLPRRVATVQK